MWWCGSAKVCSGVGVLRCVEVGWGVLRCVVVWEC